MGEPITLYSESGKPVTLYGRAQALIFEALGYTNKPPKPAIAPEPGARPVREATKRERV